MTAVMTIITTLKTTRLGGASTGACRV